MRVNGVIAEYNPFHNGHRYQLHTAKEQTGADYTIIVMSGNFVQRGAPALVDKFIRTKMVLLGGADLVLELPAYYAASSAEYFAMGAVSLLDRLGVTDHLCFGSECGDIRLLEQIASILITEPESYSQRLRSLLSMGLSYPTARTTALIEYDPSLSCHRDVFAFPNNILGIEYIKAIRRRESSMVPYTTLRVGSDYRDIRLGTNQSSSKAIRQSLKDGHDQDAVKSQIPENAYAIFEESLRQTAPVFANDLSSILHYKLLSVKDRDYTRFLDVSAELSDRIAGHLYLFRDYESFCDLLKTKNMTYTRISRCLLHILLNITTEHMQSYIDLDYVPYARVLGFRKDSTALLSAINQNASIPLLSKLADAKDILDPKAYSMLQEDLYISDIYQSISTIRGGNTPCNECSRPIVIV